MIHTKYQKSDICGWVFKNDVMKYKRRETIRWLRKKDFQKIRDI